MSHPFGFVPSFSTRSVNPPASYAPSPFPNTPPSSTASSSSSSSSPLNVAPSATTPAAVESSRPEEVLQWHFSQLDVDGSRVLSEREARPLRQFLRRRLKPRRCAKKFAQYCDRDGDRGLTLQELRVCLGLWSGLESWAWLKCTVNNYLINVPLFKQVASSVFTLFLLASVFFWLHVLMSTCSNKHQYPRGHSYNSCENTN